MLLKWIFIAGLIMIFPGLLVAQENASGISIVSNPPGAEAVLKGDLTIAGVTPVLFMQNLEGRYQLQLKRPGYETYKEGVYFQLGRPMSFNITLKPRTRFKAMARSVFIPGWGQLYSGQKIKGGVFFLLFAGASISYLVADSDFRDKRDYYDDLEDEFRASNSYEVKQRLYPILAEAREEVYDAESVRRITVGAVATAWALNILDVLFNFPDVAASMSEKSLTIEPNLEEGGGMVIFAHRF